MSWDRAVRVSFAQGEWAAVHVNITLISYALFVGVVVLVSLWCLGRPLADRKTDMLLICSKKDGVLSLNSFPSYPSVVAECLLV